MILGDFDYQVLVEWNKLPKEVKKSWNRTSYDIDQLPECGDSWMRTFDTIQQLPIAFYCPAEEKC